MKTLIDMSRGKPDNFQVRLSREMYDTITDEIFNKYIHYFNYGGIEGIEELRIFFSNLIDVPFNEILVNDNSSLRLIYDILSWFSLKGVGTGDRPWCENENISFICPVPGYDRHFSILENLGIKMISVDLTSYGPDMDLVEQLVASNENIKGMICVPTFSNPTGIVFSDSTIRKLARMKTAANDFRIFWDDAYKFHSFESIYHPKKLNLLNESKKFGNEDRVLMFLSTSKITVPGAGISMVCSSQKNIEYIKTLLNVQSVGPNKVNQLEHFLFLKNLENFEKIMKKHANLLKPKFDFVDTILHRYLDGYKDINWNKPKGGYFISVQLPCNTASKIVEECLKNGVKLTSAGSEYPYKINPKDNTIRLAPSYVSIDELKVAMKILCEVILKVIAGVTDE